MTPNGMAALSAAQIEELHNLLHDAENYLARTAAEDGRALPEPLVDGVVISNHGPGISRFVLVVANQPQTGDEHFDHTYDFEGELLFTGSPLDQELAVA